MKILDWDSEFFGKRIAEADAAALEADAIDAWCRRERIDCVYLRVEPDDQAAIDRADSQGFRLVDLRVTLGAKGWVAGNGSPEPAPAVRVAESSDVPALKDIARRSHHDTRFYIDGRFDRDRCDELYAIWIEKSCNGWADRVFVTGPAGAPAGYLTCHIRSRDEGQVGLVGVAEGSRGQRNGAAMVEAARKWFAEQGVPRVFVVTAGRNAAALGFYQRSGFTVSSVQLSYHKWY